MITVTFVLAVIANIIAVFTLLVNMSTDKALQDLDNGVKECIAYSRTNKLLIDTLDNKVNKPKAKRGRPKKNVKPVVHHLNGKQ